MKERITWVEVSGVPLHCWNSETFKRISGIWGEVVSMGENLSGVTNFEAMEILVSVKRMEPIEDMVVLEVGDNKFSVRVKEKGWSESTENGVKNKEVVEGISESESVIGSEDRLMASGSRKGW